MRSPCLKAEWPRSPQTCGGERATFLCCSLPLPLSQSLQPWTLRFVTDRGRISPPPRSRSLAPVSRLTFLPKDLSSLESGVRVCTPDDRESGVGYHCGGSGQARWTVDTVFPQPCLLWPRSAPLLCCGQRALGSVGWDEAALSAETSTLMSESFAPAEVGRPVPLRGIRLGCGSVLEHLTSRCEACGSSLEPPKKRTHFNPIMSLRCFQLDDVCGPAGSLEQGPPGRPWGLGLFSPRATWSIHDLWHCLASESPGAIKATVCL